MTRTIFAALIFMFSYASAQTAAEAPSEDSCSTIRMDDPTQPMAHVMVHDQGKSGICYAEAAAQLADAYRFGVLKEKNFARQTAPAVAAIKGSEISNDPKDPFGGGYTCQVVDYIRKSGSHDNAVFASCRARVSALKSAQFDSIFDDYQSKIYERRSQLEAVGALSHEALDAYAMQVTAQKQKDLAICAASAGGAPAEATGVRDQLVPSLAILHTYFDQHREKFTGEMIDYACSNQDAGEKLSKLPQCHPLRLNTGASKDQLMKKIDDQFRAKPLLPTAIGYCDQTLLQGRAYAGIASVEVKPPAVNCTASADDGHGGTGRHESLLIGRRRDAKGICQYLIRNSWGSACTRKASNKQIARYSADWECEEGKGNIWVDRDAIAKSLFEVSYLK